MQVDLVSADADAGAEPVPLDAMASDSVDSRTEEAYVARRTHISGKDSVARSMQNLRHKLTKRRCS